MVKDYKIEGEIEMLEEEKQRNYYKTDAYRLFFLRQYYYSSLNIITLRSTHI